MQFHLPDMLAPFAEPNTEEDQESLTLAWRGACDTAQRNSERSDFTGIQIVDACTQRGALQWNVNIPVNLKTNTASFIV